MAVFLAKIRDRKPAITLDLILGLRGWGLILYGALPSNLALLGVLEVKLANVPKLLPFLLPVSLLPLLITFLLIRSRHKDWYLTTELLNTRSAVVTLLIVLCASLISGASGLIHGKYFLSLQTFGTPSHVRVIAESLLTGIGSLVLSSTLFLTILSKESNLPGIPSSELVKLIGKTRGRLKRLQSYSIWTMHNASDESKMIADAKEIQDGLDEILTYPNHHLVKLSLESVRSGIQCFLTAMSEIDKGGNIESKRRLWLRYFGQPDVLAGWEQRDREAVRDAYFATQGLKQLRLGK